MNSRRSKSLGFTLVELQIALLILVLIGAVLVGGLQLSEKSNKAAVRLGNESSNMRIISRFLNQQITGILPLTALHNNKSELIFKGGHNSIYYMGQLPNHVVTGAPWLIHLYLTGNQIQLEYKVFDNTQSIRVNLADGFEQLTLLENVDEFTLYYRKEGSNKSTSSWQTSWLDKNIMPQQIKFKVSHNKQQWPDLIVPVYSYQATVIPFNVLEIHF